MGEGGFEFVREIPHEDRLAVGLELSEPLPLAGLLELGGPERLIKGVFLAQGLR